MSSHALETTSVNPASRAVPVNASLLQRKCACGQHTIGGAQCDACSREEQRRDRPNAVPPIVNDVLRSSGQPIAATARGDLEQRFGQDFSDVQVHTGEHASRSARSVDALAYTVGRHIVFRDGHYRPDLHAGRRLLAHELFHVTQQQSAAKSDPVATAITDTDSDAERQADRAADDVMSGRSPAAPSRIAPSVQREPAPEAASQPASTPASAQAADETPSCGDVELFTFLDMPFYMPNAYFRGDTWLEKADWEQQKEAASKDRCVAPASIPNVKLEWDLGNPKLGKAYGQSLNKNDITFDVTTYAIHDGKPCCPCLAGNVSWVFDVAMTRGTEQGRTKSPMVGSRSTETCEGERCCAVDEMIEIGVRSGFDDVTVDFTGRVTVSASTFGERRKASTTEPDPGKDPQKKKKGLGAGAIAGIVLGSIGIAAGVGLGIAAAKGAFK